jgi:hypothetical protein
MKSPILLAITLLSMLVTTCFAFKLPNAYDVLALSIIYLTLFIGIWLMISSNIKPLLIEEKEYNINDINDINDKDFEEIVEKAIRRREIKKLRQKIKNMNKEIFKEDKNK